MICDCFSFGRNGFGKMSHSSKKNSIKPLSHRHSKILETNYFKSFLFFQAVKKGGGSIADFNDLNE